MRQKPRAKSREAGVDPDLHHNQESTPHTEIFPSFFTVISDSDLNKHFSFRVFFLMMNEKDTFDSDSPTTFS